jgi:sporulation protein YabP
MASEDLRGVRILALLLSFLRSGRHRHDTGTKGQLEGERTVEMKSQEHRLLLSNRQRLEVSGVRHVDSFDDKSIVLETVLGMLHLKGENLHIKQLSLEQEKLEVEGDIQGLEYSESREDKRGRGLLARLLK